MQTFFMVTIRDMQEFGNVKTRFVCRNKMGAGFIAAEMVSDFCEAKGINEFDSPYATEIEEISVYE